MKCLVRCRSSTSSSTTVQPPTRSTSVSLLAATTRPTPTSCGRSPATTVQARSSTLPVTSAMLLVARSSTSATTSQPMLTTLKRVPHTGTRSTRPTPVATTAVLTRSLQPTSRQRCTFTSSAAVRPMTSSRSTTPPKALWWSDPLCALMPPGNGVQRRHDHGMALWKRCTDSDGR
jgi:hypothetical protein